MSDLAVLFIAAAVSAWAGYEVGFYRGESSVFRRWKAALDEKWGGPPGTPIKTEGQHER